MNIYIYICYAGKRNEKAGYESLVEATTAVARNFNPSQQLELVNRALKKAIPSPLLQLASSFSFFLIVNMDHLSSLFICATLTSDICSFISEIFTLFLVDEEQMRTLFPETKFSREFFAVFTSLFFAWLVGPCQVKFLPL